MSYQLVDLDYRVVKTIAALPARHLSQLAKSTSDAPVDRIGPGDVLSITLFPITLRSSTDDGGQKAFPKTAVEADGTVTVPFAGSVKVAGLTAGEAVEAIQRALKGKMVAPQVSVSVATNIANSVILLGEVKTPGRHTLSSGNDRLLEVIADAGGATKPAADITVSLVRGNATATTTLAALLADPAENIRLAPRDQIRMTFAPRKFMTFGALARIDEAMITDDQLSLAGAISRAGGLDNNSANASAVLVFRLERPEVAEALGVKFVPTPNNLVPMVYRLNMSDPTGFFIAGQFNVQADDIIYSPRAGVAQLRKFLDLVNSVTQVTYNLRVAAVLP